MADDRHLIIMEDDLNFAPDFLDRWPNAISELLATDWSIFYPAIDVSPHAVGLSLMPPFQELRTTHFMLINRNSSKMIVAGLQAILARPVGHPNGVQCMLTVLIRRSVHKIHS